MASKLVNGRKLNGSLGRLSLNDITSLAPIAGDDELIILCRGKGLYSYKHTTGSKINPFTGICATKKGKFLKAVTSNGVDLLLLIYEDGHAQVWSVNGNTRKCELDTRNSKGYLGYVMSGAVSSSTVIIVGSQTKGDRMKVVQVKDLEDDSAPRLITLGEENGKTMPWLYGCTSLGMCANQDGSMLTLAVGKRLQQHPLRKQLKKRVFEDVADGCIRCLEQEGKSNSKWWIAAGKSIKLINLKSRQAEIQFRAKAEVYQLKRCPGQLIARLSDGRVMVWSLTGQHGYDHGTYLENFGATSNVVRFDGFLWSGVGSSLKKFADIAQQEVDCLEIPDNLDSDDCVMNEIENKAPSYLSMTLSDLLRSLRSYLTCDNPSTLLPMPIPQARSAGDHWDTFLKCFGEDAATNGGIILYIIESITNITSISMSAKLQHLKYCSYTIQFCLSTNWK